MKYFIGAFIIVVVVLMLFSAAGCALSSERVMGEEDWEIEDGAFEVIRFSNCGCGCTSIIDIESDADVKAKGSQARSTQKAVPPKK